jgi:GT2 family glycosyltransferase
VPELYDRIFDLRQRRYVARGYAATANLVVPRAVFERVGPFDAALMSGGDKEWNGRATRAGVPIRYSDAVRIRHAARASFEALAAKRARVVGGRAALGRKRGLRARLSLLRLALPSASAVARIFREPGLSPGVRARLLLLAYRLQLVELRTRQALLAGKARAARA